MKKFLIIILSIILACSALSFTACKKDPLPNGEQGEGSQSGNEEKPEGNQPEDNKPNEGEDKPDEEPDDKKDEEQQKPTPKPDPDPEPDPEPEPQPDPDPQPQPEPQPQPQPDEGDEADDSKCLGESIEQGFIMQAYNTAVVAFADGMGDLDKAASLTHKISVSSGNLIVYSLSEEYTKADGGFLLKSTEKTLNDLGGDEAYTTQENSENVSALSFSKALSFSLKDFRDMPTLSLNFDEVEGQFSKNIAKRIFGIEENISTVDIHMKRAGDNVTYAEFSFTFEDFTITIEIQANY